VWRHTGCIPLVADGESGRSLQFLVGLIERPNPPISSPSAGLMGWPKFRPVGVEAAERLGGQPPRPGPPGELPRTRPGDLKLTVGASPQYLLNPRVGKIAVRLTPRSMFQAGPRISASRQPAHDLRKLMLKAVRRPPAPSLWRWVKNVGELLKDCRRADTQAALSNLG